MWQTFLTAPTKLKRAFLVLKPLSYTWKCNWTIDWQPIPWLDGACCGSCYFMKNEKEIMSKVHSNSSPPPRACLNSCLHNILYSSASNLLLASVFTCFLLLVSKVWLWSNSTSLHSPWHCNLISLSDWTFCINIVVQLSSPFSTLICHIMFIPLLKACSLQPFSSFLQKPTTTSLSPYPSNTSSSTLFLSCTCPLKSTPVIISLAGVSSITHIILL